MSYVSKIKSYYGVVAFDLPIDDDLPSFKPMPKALTDALDKWYDEYELQSMDYPQKETTWVEWLNDFDPKKITGIPEYALEFDRKNAKPNAFEALKTIAKQFGLVAETVKVFRDDQYVIFYTGRK